MFRKIGTDSILDWPLETGKRITLAVGRVLGKGGFGKCYELFARESGQRYACKVIDKHSQQYQLTKEKVQSEVALHRRMQHPHIVRFESYHEDERFIYILLELCNNNTLDDVLHRRKQLTEIEVRYYMRQILEGVRYIHEQRVVHRDLKLENFFISEQMTVKIGDFGLASALPLRARRKSICGTPHYMAPEIFSSREGYSYEIDIWSLGVIAYLLLTGRFPFDDRDPDAVTNQLKKGLIYHSRVSQHAQSFVAKMLQPSPAQRNSIRQLLKHDFLNLYEIPEIIPLSCLVCEPTRSFTEKYVGKRKQEEEEGKEEEKFQFMLESKQSPESQVGGNSMELTYQQVQSELADGQPERVQLVPLSPENFGYQSKRHESCHITQWIAEYWEHSRYGLLYRTSDGLLGMRFNDGSNLKLTDHTQQSFIYLNGTKQISLSLASLSTFSQDMRVKIGVLLRLSGDLRVQEGCSCDSPLFVRLYLNTLSVFLIWLSNGTLQGRFSDGSQLLLSVDSCMHIDQRGKTVFPSRSINLQPQHIQEKKNAIQEVIARVGRLRRELKTQQMHGNMRQFLPVCS